MSHHYIEFRNVGYRYPSGQVALEDVSFRINHGEHVALVGANGAGKSTLLHLCCGILLPTTGEIVVGGVRVESQQLREIRRQVGIVFQNPDDQLIMSSVEEEIAFGPLNMGYPAEEVERLVEQAMQQTSTTHLRTRPPYNLSGGEKKGVAIASVLAMEPSVILMDEPSAFLDPRARRLMMELVESFGHTILLSSHDMGLVERLCPRTLLLHRGKLMADGVTSELLGDKELMERCELL